MFAGDDEVYGFAGCMSLRLPEPENAVHMPDCVVRYALCKFTLLACRGRGIAIIAKKEKEGDMN